MTAEERVRRFMDTPVDEWPGSNAAIAWERELISEFCLAVAEEREACAAIADAHGEICPPGIIDTGIIWRGTAARAIAKAIRARVIANQLKGVTP